MLNELDETIRQVLIKEGSFDPAAVDVSFEIPTREWSAGISKPTLNCYLFDIHERRLLREDGWQLERRGTREAARRQPPLYYEMTYLITAWTSAVEDEHRLLWHVLRTLMRFPTLPVEHLQGPLRDYEWPIHTTIAQLEGVLKSPGEFWTALENHLKPSVSYVITLALDRESVPAGLPVLSTGIRVQLPESTAAHGFRLDQVFQLPKGTSLRGVTVEVENHNQRAVTDDDGHFQFADLVPNRYTLKAEIEGQTYRRVIIIRGITSERSRSQFSDVILDQNDQPLKNVEVTVEGSDLRAVTDDKGRFTLNLPPGRYTLRIQFDGWNQRRQITVRESDAKHKLTLGYGGVPLDDGQGAKS